MLELREQAQSKGIRFELMNLNKWVRYVLEVSRLDSVFEVKSEVECLPTVSRNRRAPAPWLASCAWPKRLPIQKSRLLRDFESFSLMGFGFPETESLSSASPFP